VKAEEVARAVLYSRAGMVKATNAKKAVRLIRREARAELFMSSAVISCTFLLVCTDETVITAEDGPLES
jgi:hypothetical protein